MAKQKKSDKSDLEGTPAQPQGMAELIAERLKNARVYSPREAEVSLLTTPGEPWIARSETGKALRENTPRESHGNWKPRPDRPDPMVLIQASNVGRVPELIPLRMQRMAESPFAFLRGAAVVMAWDLAHTPSMGLNVVIDGDCHINNFGLFGTPQGEIVLDLNDFDEATIAPWEWDLKRLAASINLSGRDNGLSKGERRRAVLACSQGYRWSLERLQSISVMDLWQRHTAPSRLSDPQIKPDKKSIAIARKAIAKARASNNDKMLKTAAERDVDGRWRLRLEPPITTAISAAERANIIVALHDYLKTLAPERAYMIRRYHIVDIAHRVVGVGSVGLRAYVILLLGNGDNDALFLQMKEAAEPAHAAHLPVLPEIYKHQGQRVVYGQRLLQAVGDPMLGWTTMDGRPFYVRQMKNLKGAIPTEWLSGTPFNFFAWGYGSLLARAHSRVGDAAVLNGYCGKSDVLDVAIADWAEAYGDQTLIDHAAFAAAVRSKQA